MIDERYQTGKLRNMTTEELQDELESFRKEQFNLKYQLSTGQLERTNQFPHIRKAIARVKTLLKERQLAGEEG